MSDVIESISGPTWDEFLAGLDEETRVEAVEWADSCPEPIRDLVKKYPPGTRMKTKGVTCYLLGFAEVEEDRRPGILLSVVDPNEHYELSSELKFVIDAIHLPK